MIRTALMSAAATVALTLPALAAAPQPNDPKPCGTTKTILCAEYKPDEATSVPMVPGTTVRIEMGMNEFIASVDVSNQDVLDGGDDVQASDAGTPVKTSTDPAVPSCDINLCRHVTGRFLFLGALRPLTEQPLFVTTHYCANGVPPGSAEDRAAFIRACPDQSYTLVLGPGTAPLYALRFEYPDRDKALKVAAARAAYQRRLADERDRQEHMPHPVAAPADTGHRQYIFVGKDRSIAPDTTWDDGRTTYMFYRGNREPAVPFRYLDPRHETSDVAYASEPSPDGTTLRITGTRPKWCLRKGDTVGCVYNANPDPIGATAQTIAVAGAQ